MIHKDFFVHEHPSTNLSHLLLTEQTIVSAVKQRRENFYHFEKHIHKNIEVYQILTGTCCMDIQNKTITCQSGDLVVIMPNVVHSFFLTKEEACTFRHVHFNTDFYSSLYLDVSNQSKESDAISLLTSLFFCCDSYYQAPTSPKIDYLLAELIEETKKDSLFSRANANLYVTQLLLYILETAEKNVSVFNQKSSKQNHYVAFALSYIHKHYEYKILTSDISEKLNISNRYLSQIFFQKMNLTLLNYINIYRINKAIELMASTDLSLTMISGQIGLKDSQHFSKLFRTIIGITPLKYKQMLKSSSLPEKA